MGVIIKSCVVGLTEIYALSQSDAQQRSNITSNLIVDQNNSAEERIGEGSKVNLPDENPVLILLYRDLNQEVYFTISHK